MNWQSKLKLYSWAMVLLLLLAYLLWQLPDRAWHSSLTGMMPQAEQPWQQELLTQMNSSQQVAVMLTGLPLTDLRQVATALREQSLHWQWQDPAETLSQLQLQYQNHQSLLVSAEAFNLLQQQHYQPLVDAALQRLYSPAPLLRGALKQDPLLLTQQFLEQQSATSKLLPQHGWFELEAPAAVVMTAEILIDPFDQAQAIELVDAWQFAVTELSVRWPELEIIQGGVLFHATEAADRARFEMRFFGGWSLLGIVVLLGLYFVSIRPLLLAKLVLVCAMSAGMVALLLSYKQPHVLTLVFATTLLGIAIDYSFHGMLAANRGAVAFKAMLPQLLLGLVTTLMGYLILLWLPFPLLQQVALFMLAGLVAAFVTVWLCFSVFVPAQSLTTNRRINALIDSASWYYQQIPVRRFWWLASTSTLVVFALFMGMASFSDDIRLFNQSSDERLLDEQRLRAVAAQPWDSRFLVILAESLEQGLQREEELQAVLQHWQEQGWIQQWQGITQQLPSLQTQEQTRQMLQQAYQSEVVTNYLAELQLPAPAITQERLAAWEFVSPLTQQIVSLEQEQALIILLRDIRDLAAIEHSLSAWGDVHLLDPVANTNQTLMMLRQQLTGWLVGAVLLASLMLSWRRGLYRGVAIGLVLCTVTSGALFFSLLLQSQLNVFNLVGAILVLALTVDYTVFFTARLRVEAIFQAVFLSAVTSCLAFGMLSFSQTPAVASFGRTVFIGIVLAAFLSPMLIALTPKEVKTINGTL